MIVALRASGAVPAGIPFDETDFNKFAEEKAKEEAKATEDSDKKTTEGSEQPAKENE